MEPADVPHFVLDAKGSGVIAREKVRGWLRARGLTLLTTAYLGNEVLEDVLGAVGMNNPGIYYILGGASSLGTGHSVVCLGDRIVHDPSLDDTGIVGPMEDDLYYVEFIGSAVACQGVGA